MAPKGNDWRPCGDYRLLNMRTKPDCYPVPHIADFASTIHGSRIFSKVDLVKAFHQIPMAKEDVEKTAVITPFGLFEYTRMPFGLRNAAQTFQRFIDEVVRGLPFVYSYIDDLLVASPDAETHETHLKLLFERLNQYGIAISPGKCVFGVPQLLYLGHIVDEAGVSPDPEKVSAIRDTELPLTTRGLRRFLGMVNFYRRFIPHAADVTAHLNELLKTKEKNVVWTPESETAFTATKEALASATLLHHPRPAGRLILLTDASDVAVGAALNEIPFPADDDQPVADKLRPLSFFSKKLSLTEQKYSAFDKELLAVYLSIRYFRHYLEASQFTIYTDHKPLTYALSRATDKYTPRQARQLDFIAQYTSDIRHVKGEANVVADALSRPAIESLDQPGATRWSLDLDNLASEQSKDAELKSILAAPEKSGLKLEQIPCPTSAGRVWADTSTGRHRLFVPMSMRKAVFESLHNLSHPSRRATRRLVTDRFVWPSVNHDTSDWSRACVQCQKSKITRHTMSPVGSFLTTDRRFSHVHIDIVGPLPERSGFKYLLTAVDRASRWPEAWPITNITAETIAEALVANWVSRFGCPSTITTDRGMQFESRLFRRLTELLGSTRVRTTAYHPASNGLVERFHRTLKASLTAVSRPWPEALPLVLLGLRSAVKEDMGVSASEMAYGTTLRLPADLLEPRSDPIAAPEEPDFVNQLRQVLDNLRPATSRSPPSTRKVFVHKDLTTCSHVFIREDKTKQPLTPAYEGPYQVIKRDEKVFVVMVKGKEATVSIDRLKPTYFESQPATSGSPTPLPQPVTPEPMKLRSGRHIRFASSIVRSAHWEGSYCSDSA